MRGQASINSLNTVCSAHFWPRSRRDNCDALPSVMRLLSHWPAFSQMAALAHTLIGFTCLSICLLSHAQSNPDTTKAHVHPKFMGTGSCSSSNCHGSVNPINGSDVLQNEYHTWLKYDRHSKAYSALTTPDAKRIASHLNLGDPAKEAQCLTCHTTYVPNRDQRGERYAVEDGVSCESCHGAAERWIASHAERSATHERNLANGLVDTASLNARATLCLSCHYGDDSKRVTHDLYGAGHPRLRFELDTYGILQPKHWVVDGDYQSRKSDYIPLRAWFAGQLAQAESLLVMLGNPHSKTQRGFPELSLFDCFSCHHNLTQNQWKNRTYGETPGTLQLNLTPLLLLQASLAFLDAEKSLELARLSANLQKSFGTDTMSQTLSELRTLLKSQVRPFIANIRGDMQTCSTVVRGLAQESTNVPTPKFEFAEQVGMGIQAALATSPELAKQSSAQLSRLFKTLERADSFDPQSFSAALQGFAILSS